MPLVVAALVLVTVAYLVMLATKPGGIDLVVRLSDATTAAAAAAASVTCGFAGRRHASSMRAFWWLLAAACGAWASGEVIWTWYEEVLSVPVPYPSWADVGFLAGLALGNLQPGNRPATAMLLGGLVMAVSDTAFTYLAHIDGYSSGDLIDAGWFASYLAIAAAALVYESPVEGARSKRCPHS